MFCRVGLSVSILHEAVTSLTMTSPDEAWTSNEILWLLVIPGFPLLELSDRSSKMQYNYPQLSQWIINIQLLFHILSHISI